jgi:hypothetical protein
VPLVELSHLPYTAITAVASATGKTKANATFYSPTDGTVAIAFTGATINDTFALYVWVDKLNAYVPAGNATTDYTFTAAGTAGVFSFNSICSAAHLLVSASAASLAVNSGTTHSTGQ